MIKIQKLNLEIGSHHILRNIDLEIFEREITVIVGKSGSGKTVLIKTIFGLLMPVSGTVSIDGIDIFSLNKKELYQIRKKLALLFQNSALLDSYNVFQNIALPLIEHTELAAGKIKKMVSEKLQAVGLLNPETKFPAELSGGMKKRVALARAIIMQPKYIFLDEPTSGLDPQTAEEISKLILKLQNQFDLTTIIVTHDLKFIDKIARRLIMLDDGKIIFDGTYDDFKKASDSKIRNFRRDF